MQIFTHDETIGGNRRSIVSVGNFDGVHKGHQLLIGEMVRRAREAGMTAALVTFEPHTRFVVNDDGSFEVLTTFEEKSCLLERTGIDVLVCIPFTPAFRRHPPESFVESVLVKRLNAAEWVMGTGHRIGADRAGGEKFLHTVLSKYHIIPFTADLLKQQTTVVSSTKIRNTITDGRLIEAVRMLGHPYLISTERIEGLKIGSQLGFPTLNFSKPAMEKVLPPAGVYAAEMEFGGVMQPGALYFGECPTFSGRPSHFEFHALENVIRFPEKGETVRLWIHAFIRRDRSFPAVDALVARISEDIHIIRKFFIEEKPCH